MAEPFESPGVESRLAQQKRIRKELRLSSDEWEQVARRLDRAGETNFSRFARLQLVNGCVVMPPSKADEDVVRQLAWIGNNLNQIAKKANATQVVTYEMAVDATRQFHEVYAVLRAVYGEQVSGGRSQNPQHIQGSR